MKYQPDYPGRFASVLHARAWLQAFFGWHNDDHHHSGLALFTPAEVFFQRVVAVHAVRQEALDAAYALHPGRFPNGPPKAALPPAEVNINPLEALTVAVCNTETISSAKINAAPLDDAALAHRSERASHATASTPRHETLAANAAFPS
jgi:putative transposase